jgi:hypothetical protein
MVHWNSDPYQDWFLDPFLGETWRLGHGTYAS